MERADDARLWVDESGRQRVDDEPVVGAVVDAEEAGDVADLRRTSGRERPLIERIRSRQHRLAIGAENSRRIERRVERHTEKGETVANPCFIGAAADALEVLDDQRAEVGSGHRV